MIIVEDEYSITFYSSQEAADNKCKMLGCALRIGHKGPHAMSTAYARPDLPTPTAEEDEAMMKRLTKIGGKSGAVLG
jgi:hypothetical protein